MWKGLYFSLLILFALPSFAENFTEQAHSKAHFVSENQSLQTGKNWFGLYVELEDHWHTYWQNPGDSASAPYFNFQLPKGIKFIKTHFPKPQRITTGPLQSFAYEKEVLFLFEIEVDNSFKGEAEIALETEWLVCREECIPGVFTFKVNREWSESAAPSEFSTKFAHFKSLLPEVTRDIAQLEIKSETIQLDKLPNFEGQVVDVFPFDNKLVSNEKPNIESDKVLFKVSQNKDFNNNEAQFLVLTNNKSYELTAKPLVDKEALWMMLLFAFLGGLLLNLMPCVFPVLGIKVYSLIGQKEKNKTEVLVSNLLYVLGILVSFWGLALVIAIIRSAGTTIGWGFQLQSPIFVGCLIVLFLFMTLLFLDVIPLSFASVSGAGDNLAKKQGYLGSFFTGVLAVVVASPCTAPFMGAAMGYALSQSYLFIFLIFTSLGLGLAFPFLVFSFYPKAFLILPRPGAWMVTFKKLMAIPLLLTTVWLGWVLALQMGLGSAKDTNNLWTEFTQEKLEAELNQGNAVFVNFTAAWCITCQVNERLVFQMPEVKDFFKVNKIIPLKADWTKKDEKIGRILKEYNRAGVPLYLYYKPSQAKAHVLPEILTVDLLKDHLTTKN